MDPKFLEQLFAQPFVVVLLVLVLIGGRMRWWVYGWQYDDVREIAREATAMMREQAAALKEVAQTSRGTYELLKKTVERPGGGGS